MFAILAITTFLLIPAAARAEVPPDPPPPAAAPPFTCLELLRRCTAFNATAVERQYCYGFIYGGLGQFGPASHVCAPPDVQTEQLIQGIITYTHQAPTTLNDNAEICVYEGMKLTYPCAVQTQEPVATDALEEKKKKQRDLEESIIQQLKKRK
ncbi:MAG: Rap1a/Tai family immunity protein [Alphaproteobacteria bacterium]